MVANMARMVHLGWRGSQRTRKQAENKKSTMQQIRPPQHDAQDDRDSRNAIGGERKGHTHYFN